jgi:AcrR family transcriptional regulator
MGERTSKLPAHIELAWGLRESGKRGPRPGLSLGRIVDEAIALADEAGLAAVSMSRVAARLGFTTMSLYRYVDSKDDLVALMRDRAIGPPPELEPGQGWRAALARWTKAQLATQHAWWIEIPVAGVMTMPNSMLWLERGLATMADTGLTLAEKADVALVLSSLALAQLRLTRDLAAVDSDVFQNQMSAVAALADPERFPGVRALLAEGAFEDDSVGSGSSMDFALERLLDGVQMLIDRRSGEHG